MMNDYRMNGVLRFPSSVWALFAKETQWLIIFGIGFKNAFALMIRAYCKWYQKVTKIYFWQEECTKVFYWWLKSDKNEMWLKWWQ